MVQKIIVYGSPICFMVGPVRNILDRAEIDYDYVDIFKDAQARETVRTINNGYESVPTLRFPDGTTLTEPASGELEQKLVALGYEVPPATGLEHLWLLVGNPVVRIIGIVSLVVGISSGSQLFLALGIIILGLAVLSVVIQN